MRLRIALFLILITVQGCTAYDTPSSRQEAADRREAEDRYVYCSRSAALAGRCQ